MEEAGVCITDNDLDSFGAFKLLESTKHFEPSKRRRILIEFAARFWMRALTFSTPAYSEFEESLWLAFESTADLEDMIRSHIYCATVASDAKVKYHDYLRGMFKMSEKTREEFYDDMLAESGVEMSVGSVDFGESAIAFYNSVETVKHREHLLVFYSVELFLKAYASVHPRSSPISDEKVEEFYKHFERAISLTGKFEKYAANDNLFKCNAKHRTLPQVN